MEEGKVHFDLEDILVYQTLWNEGIDPDVLLEAYKKVETLKNTNFPEEEEA